MRRLLVFHINLDHIPGCGISHVFHRHMHSHIPGLSILRENFRMFHLHITVSQSVSEGIERLLFHITVSPASHAVILESRQVIQGTVKGYRQLSRRGTFPEQNVRHRLSSPRARIPELQNRIRLLLRLRKVNRASRHQAYHHRLAHSEHCLHQLPLGFRQKQIRLIPGRIAVARIPLFSFQRLIQSHAEHHHITVLCHCDCFRNPVIFPSQIFHPVFEQMRAFGV